MRTALFLGAGYPQENNHVLKIVVVRPVAP